MWQDTAGAKGLLTKGLTCLGHTPHTSQYRLGQTDSPPHCSGSIFLAHRAIAEGCRVWVQDIPDWRQRGVKEMQVGDTSLGWSGVKAEGMKSGTPGARLGLGDVQCASLCPSTVQGQQAASRDRVEPGTRLLSVLCRGGVPAQSPPLWVCQKTPMESRGETGKCLSTCAPGSL